MAWKATDGTKTGKPTRTEPYGAGEMRRLSPTLRALTRDPVVAQRLPGGAPPVPPARDFVLPRAPAPAAEPPSRDAAIREAALAEIGRKYAASGGPKLPAGIPPLPEGGAPKLPPFIPPMPQAPPPGAPSPVQQEEEPTPTAPGAAPTPKPGPMPWSAPATPAPATGGGSGAAEEEGPVSPGAPAPFGPPAEPTGPLAGAPETEGFYVDPDTGEQVPVTFDANGWPIGPDGQPVPWEKIPDEWKAALLQDQLAGWDMIPDYAPGRTQADLDYLATPLEEITDTTLKGLLKDQPGIDDDALQAQEEAIWRQSELAKAALSDQLAAAGLGGTGAAGLNIGNLDAQALNEVAKMRLQAELAEDEATTQRMGMLLEQGFKDKTLEQQAKEFAETFGLEQQKLDEMLKDDAEADAWQTLVNWMAARGETDTSNAYITAIVEGIQAGKSLSQILADLKYGPSGAPGQPGGGEPPPAEWNAEMGPGKALELFEDAVKGNYQAPPPDWVAGADERPWWALTPTEKGEAWQVWLGEAYGV